MNLDLNLNVFLGGVSRVLTYHIYVVFFVDQQKERHEELLEVLSRWKSEYVNSVGKKIIKIEM